MKNIILIIITLTLVVAVLAGVFLAQKAIKNQAIDDCLKAGVAKFVNEAGQDVEVPDGYWYDFCMSEKNLK